LLSNSDNQGSKRLYNWPWNVIPKITTSERDNTRSSL